MSIETEHELREPRQLSYPGGKDGLWVVDCSCGYQSQPSGSPQGATKPAVSHRDAKTAQSGR